MTAIPFTAFAAEADGGVPKLGYARKSQYVLFSSGESGIQLNTTNTTLNGNLYGKGNLYAYSNKVDVRGNAVLSGELHKREYTDWNSYKFEDNAETHILTDFTAEMKASLGEAYTTHEYWQTYSGTDVMNAGNIFAQKGLQFCGNDVTLGGTIMSENYLMISASHALNTVEGGEMNLYVANGNIGIYCEDADINGVIYAPNGTVQICGSNIKINGLIIAKEIQISAQDVVINENTELSMAQHIKCYNDQILAANASYDLENELFNVDLYSSLEGGNYFISTSTDGVNYSVDGATTENTYSFPIDEPVEALYIKVKQIFDNGFVLNSNVVKMIADEEYGYIMEQTDTDGEGLLDLYEHIFGSDKNIVDTDGDGLNDYIEVMFIGTDPLYVDSDENGVDDGDEDFDGDGLTNLQEVAYGTDLTLADTDGDGLSDYDELLTYFTNPLIPDTDGDGINDGDEIALGLNPLVTDTDGDGVPDVEEKIQQTFVHETENEDCVVEEVVIESAATNRLQTTMSVDSVMGTDALCAGVVGLVGEPFEIKTTSKFDTAKILFKLDSDNLVTAIDDLIFLWYDEDNDTFVEMDTAVDSEEMTVSATTTHFSKYMIVNKNGTMHGKTNSSMILWIQIW